MAVYALGDQVPEIDPTAFVHPDAVVIGSVVIGPESSVWPSAVLRGDSGSITIGARTSIQDGCVIHTTDDHHTVVGSDCVIGHLVHLEGCTVEDRCLIGVGSVVLHRVVVHTGSVVAANAVVLNDMEVPSGAVAMGVPAKLREGMADLDDIADGVATYRARTKQYLTELRRIDG